MRCHCGFTAPEEVWTELAIAIEVYTYVEPPEIEIPDVNQGLCVTLYACPKCVAVRIPLKEV